MRALIYKWEPHLFKWEHLFIKGALIYLNGSTHLQMGASFIYGTPHLACTYAQKFALIVEVS